MIKSAIDKDFLSNWKEKIIEENKNGNLQIQIDILFYDPIKVIKDLKYAIFETKQVIEQSMYKRFLKAYEENKIKSYDLVKFDLIGNNDKTYYLCDESQFKNLKSGISNITKATPVKSFSDDDLSKAVSLCFKLTYNNNTDIAFCGIQNFNSLKYKKLSTAFMGQISSINNKNTITKVDDKSLLFGIGSKIDFVFISKAKSFIINPKGKAAFEKVFLLQKEYKQLAKSEIQNLTKFPKQLKNISQFSADYYGKNMKSTPIMDKMLAKISKGKKNKDLKALLNDQNKWKKRLVKIDNFKNDPQFAKKFNDLKIDSKKGIIEYDKKSAYLFLAVLSDRPDETILLEEKEMGN